MRPPGIPDMISRHRFVAPGTQVLDGKAWSGVGRVTRVQVGTDDGASWRDAVLSPVGDGRYTWVHWRLDWDAPPGETTLLCRATDEAGQRQPIDLGERHNIQANGVNGVQRIAVTVPP